MKKKLNGIFLLFICALCWGPAYLFIKIAIPEIPPPTLVFLRIFIAWLILYPICRLQKQAFDWKHQWKRYLSLALIINIIPYYLVSYGEFYISSALAGVLYSFTLIFVAIFGHFFGVRDPLNKNKIIGISLGIVGLLIIYLPLVFQESIKNAMGAFMVILATLSGGIGAVYAGSHLQKSPVIVVLTAQFGLGSIVLFFLALFIDSPFSLPFPSWESILSVIGLGAICTVGAFFSYYKAIQLTGPTYASFSILAVPVLAMLLGALILHEQLTWSLYVGTPLILAGILAVDSNLSKKA